jgi:two-component system NtrC family sensor kinase
MNSELNLKILIADDDEEVRISLRKSLDPKIFAQAGLDKASNAFFGRAPTLREKQRQYDFNIHEACNGREALDLVRKSVIEDQPYAVIFMGMRMPEGDGLKTVQEIRAIDRGVEIVFVTASSDHTVEEIVERAGLNVGYYCKPFAPEEIRQVAVKATYDWNRSRDLEQLIGMVSELRANENQMHVLLANILHQVGRIVGSTSSLIALRVAPGELIPEIGTGQFQDAEVTDRTLKQIRPLVTEASFPITLPDEHLLVFHLGDHHLVALHEVGRKINSENIYLLTLLLESAGASIENSRLHKENAEKERLSALGHALGGIVHDLRNPVGAIQSLAELQAKSLAASDLGEVRELQELILSSSHEAMDLLEDILDFTRGTTCTPKPLTVAALFALVEEKSSTFLKDFPVRFRIDSLPDISVQGDRKKMLRVFLNLIKNAADVLKESRTTSPEITLEAVADGEEVIFSVTDNGRGIPPEIRADLFRPFVTFGKSGGTGLGLSIVSQIVEAHGATVQLVSAPGHTCFSFSLPRL